MHAIHTLHKFMQCLHPNSHFALISHFISSHLTSNPINMSRLILLYDKPRYTPIKTQLHHLQLQNPDILEFKDFPSFPQLNFSTKPYDILTICIEYNDEFEANLRTINDFLTTNEPFVNNVAELTYHITFDGNKKWSEYPEYEKAEYFQFLSLIGNKFGPKVNQVSIINKYDVNTIYLTEKHDLTTLGEQIQTDINNYPNLKILDYSNNCLRFFPGVKFPDTLEVMNISGSYSIETLSGFKMPSLLKQLVATNNCITSIDNIQFPHDLEVLNLMDNRIYFMSYVTLPEKLRVLDLSNNRLDNVRNIDFPAGLEHLSLALNPIDNIKGVRFPEKLQFLDLSCIPNESMTGIKFPDWLISLNLQESMTTTRGLKLPNFLRNLNLSFNGVNSINPLKLPNSITMLNLMNNNIKTLNKVQFPANLTHLYLGNNLITTLKNVIFPNLEVLDLEMDPHLDDNDKRINTLRDVLLPSSLKVLKLGYQGIKALEGVDLSSLVELDLSYNDLKVIRNVKFEALEVLNVSGNEELEIDQVLPNVRELIVPGLWVLPGYMVERANRGEVIIKRFN